MGLPSAERRAMIAVAAGCLVVALVARGVAGRRARAADPAPIAHRASDRARAPVVHEVEPTGAARTDGAPPAALPASLDGTDADGAVSADASGHLVIDLELRRLFDHFLAATGEEPLATIRARIIAVVRARLPATAASEAIELLDRYLAYREAARGLAPTASDADGLDQVHQLRGKLFAPAVVKAFFADEEAATYAALARRDAMLDPTLSADERARRLAELDARVPAAVREARAAAMAPLNELNHERELRTAGAPAAQITAARTAAFGADGAARLAELDRAHAAWDARVAQFRAARAALLDDPRLDDAERGRRIDELLAGSFTPPERIRVEAIEHLPNAPAR